MPGVPDAWAWRPSLVLVERQSRKKAVAETGTVREDLWGCPLSRAALVWWPHSTDYAWG